MLPFSIFYNLFYLIFFGENEFFFQCRIVRFTQYVNASTIL